MGTESKPQIYHLKGVGMDLVKKGADAQIGAFKQLMVSLIWTSAVDLDLMAFYKTKSGQVGGVYSDNYSGGSIGDLNSFPFMQLSGDAGVGAIGGDNREEMRIMKLDDIEELYICALNFTDASQNRDSSFSTYDARVEVITDNGKKHTIALDSNVKGTVAILCKFKSGFMGAQLINDSTVMDFDSFKRTLPGASNLSLTSKITLKKKGDSHKLISKGTGNIVINLNWNVTGGAPAISSGFWNKLFKGSNTEEIDLDLGCFYELWDGQKSVIDGLQFAHNPFLQGSLTKIPYIYHLGDDRSGSNNDGEFIKISGQHLSEIKRMTIYAFIYEGVSQWDKTDAIIKIEVPNQPVLEVEMGNHANSNKFCAIAGINISAGGKEIEVTKLISFHNGHADCDNAYNWGLNWKAGSK